MAPRAEYVPYSTVRPEGPKQVTERVDISFPHVDFQNSVGRALAQVGEQGFGTLSRSTHEVGQAFDNLGKNLEHVGDQLWNRAIGLQDVQNQTTQTKAEIEFDKYVGDKQVAFNQLQGDAASEGAYKAHLKDIEDKRTEMLGKLPNQAVQKGFERSTASMVGRVGMQAAEHAAKETRRSFIESSEARVDQYKDQISKTTDIKETEDLAKRVHDEVFGKQAPAKGWTLDVATENFKKILTDAYASQAAVMSRTDPTGARKLLEANKDFISQPKYDAAMEHVLSNERTIQSNNIGNEVQETNPEAPIEEKKEEARKRSLEVNPNAPMLVEASVRAVEQKHEAHRREVRQVLERNKETVEQAVYGFGNKDGKAPTTRYELFANGEDVRKAFENLPPKEQNRIDQLLAKAAKGDFPETPATRARVSELEGMWLNNPSQFRDWDIASEDLPISARSQLRQHQLQLIKEGIKLEADPKTSHALGILRSSDVLPKDLTPQHTAKWNTFTGMLREALIEEGKRKGFDKPLTEQEIISIGRTLMDKMPGTGHWPWDWGASQVYQGFDTVPEKTQQFMRQLYPGIGDEEMLQKYRQTKIREEYNKRYQQGGAPVRAPGK